MAVSDRTGAGRSTAADRNAPRAAVRARWAVTAVFFLNGTVFSAAGHAGGEGPGAAVFVSRFTTFTYGGVLLGPALVGWCAEVFTLGWTLAALIPLMVVVALNATIVAAADEDRGRTA